MHFTRYERAKYEKEVILPTDFGSNSNETNGQSWMKHKGKGLSPTDSFHFSVISLLASLGAGNIISGVWLILQGNRWLVFYPIAPTSLRVTPSSV